MDVLQVSAPLRSSLFLHAPTCRATVYLLTSSHDVTLIVMNTCKKNQQDHQLISKKTAVPSPNNRLVDALRHPVVIADQILVPVRCQLSGLATK